MVRHGPDKLVETVDFVTSVGYGSGRGDRERLELPGGGPTSVITDLGLLAPDPRTCELLLTHVHPGVTFEQVRAATGWELRAADTLGTTPPPTAEELAAVRDVERTKPGTA